MPRAKSTTVGQSQKYLEIQSSRAQAGFRENNDCAVVAIAAATGVPYAAAHAALKAAGRKDCRGTFIHQTQKALLALGFRMINVPMSSVIATFPSPHNNLKTITSHHPERFAKVWPRGAFMLRSRRHILAIVDGVNCDWSKGRSLRGVDFYRIEPANGSPGNFSYTI